MDCETKNQKEYRHRIGMNKKYISERTGKSKTREYKNAYRRKYALLNPEKKRLWNQTRYLVSKSGGSFKQGVIQKVYEENIKRFGTLTCYLCLLPIEFGKDCIEHKIPLSRGGNSEFINLHVSCRSCNCKKHSKTLEEYQGLKEE